MANDDTEARRGAIRGLIRDGQIATQEELRERLAKEGYDVTQATLSRDLARIGARRVSRPEGGTAYELPDAPLPDRSSEERLRDVAEMVIDVVDNGTLVVIHTTPGAASAVALALDGARLEELIGTIAGDDTIFLAPSKNHPARKLTLKLNRLFQKG